MKRLYFFLYLCCMSFIMTAQAPLLEQEITMEIEKKTISEVLSSITSQQNIAFSYNNDWLPTDTFTLALDGVPLQNLLQFFFQKTDLTYLTAGNHIIIRKRLENRKRTANLKYVLEGYVTVAESGEPLKAANVFIEKSFKGAFTDDTGYFRLMLAADTLTIGVSYVGYETSLKKLSLLKDEFITFRLHQDPELTVIEILADSVQQDSFSNIPSNIIEEKPLLSLGQLQELPVIFGEADVLKSLQLLPGVQFADEASGGLSVRGGTADQNLILLDGANIYQTGHLGGIYSIFPTEIIDKINFYKSAFPAKYYGKLAAVLDVQIKDGNFDYWEGKASLGLISSKILLEGPIQKGKTSILLYFRRPYLDLLASQFIRQINNDDIRWYNYHFFDINTKITHRFSEKEKISLLLYYGRDRFVQRCKYTPTFEGDERQCLHHDFGVSHELYEEKWQNVLRWGNNVSAFNWEKKGKHIDHTLTAYYTRSGFHDKETSTNKYDDNNDELKLKFVESTKSRVYEIGLKSNWKWPISHRILAEFGATISRQNYLLTPDTINFNFINIVRQSADINLEEISIYEKENLSHLQSWSSGLHAQLGWAIGKKWFTAFGFRHTGFDNAVATHTDLLPYWNLRFSPHKNWTIQTGLSKTVQYVHAINSRAFDLPTNFWVPATDQLQPQHAWQTQVGLQVNLKKRWKGEISGYYNKIQNLTSFNRNVENNRVYLLDEVLVQGKGRAYGLEFLIQKETDRWAAWVTYHLAWHYRQFDSFNFGNEFYADTDRRHNISVAFKYKVASDWKINILWLMASGHPYSVPASFINSYSGPSGVTHQTSLPPETNTQRTPIYHRFDCSIERNIIKRRNVHTWIFGVYNLYNQKNSIFLLINEKSVEGVSIFPLIPFVNYKFQF